MPRNWHYLRASRAAGWPAQSVALSVVCSAGAVADGSRMTRSSRLLGWAATSWTGGAGRAETVRRADGVTVDSFWHWLHSILAPRRCVWLWQIHAVHGCTALGLWDALTRGDWVLCGSDRRANNGERQTDRAGGGGLCVVSDPPVLLLARPAHQSGSVCWLDVRNLSSRITWGDVGDDTGALALGGETEIDGRPARQTARGRADALAAWLGGWYDVVRDLELGGLRMTAASQAWHGWTSRYLAVPIEIHNDECRLSAERAAIYGGRNEVYRVGAACSPCCEVDATGHYPALAASNPLPGRIARSGGSCRPSAASLAADGYCVIAQGRVRTERPVLPCRRDGRTVYPVGSWTATYCWPEWQLLLASGGRAEFEHWWAYEPTDPFGEFVSALWRARTCAKTDRRRGHESAIKLLMNSLIGKCCARNCYWQDCPDELWPRPWDAWPEYDDETKTTTRMRCVAGRVQREIDDGFAADAAPALAAYVYSLGRVRLWEWQTTAGRDEIYYCDTDSLWTSEAGYDRLVAAGQMGDGELARLRLRNVHPWARFYGAKHYETPMGITCSGDPTARAVMRDGDGYAWTADTPAQAARRRLAPTSDLVRQDLYARQPCHGGRVGADGTVYPLEVYDE